MKHLLTALVFILAMLPARAQRTYWQHLRQQWPALAANAAAGSANGASDVLQFWYSTSRFPQRGPARQFWDPQVSWQNKYRNWPTDPRPAFPGATTVLVATTDGWHLFKSAQLSLATTSVVLYQPAPKYTVSWASGTPVYVPRRWWWPVADWLALRAAFATGWHLSTRALRHP